MTVASSSRWRRFALATQGLLFACVLVASACAEQSTDLGGAVGAQPAPSFTGDDASTEDAEGLIQYCASSECPAGRATCSTSRFTCDVDLMTDRNNCGACGAACPGRTFRETYECVEGSCVMQCNAYPLFLDCDGIPDNGCEIDPSTNDNCGACGKTCDPSTPCLDRSTSEFDCGCAAGKEFCLEPYAHCSDIQTDDSNCGACNNLCDFSNGGQDLPANGYFGCSGGECGHVKCNRNFSDCDGDQANGCEVSLLSDDNCGACGKACAAGQKCRANSQGTPTCMCPEGQTYCESTCIRGVCYGECYDLAVDKNNCGACGNKCVEGTPRTSTGICNYGTCTRQCVEGRADCNGNPSDECEVNTDSDPNNCGGCGIVCNAVPGQACIGGKCAVEPCNGDGGVVTR